MQGESKRELSHRALNRRGSPGLDGPLFCLDSSSLRVVWKLHMKLQHLGEQTWLPETQCLRIYTTQVLSSVLFVL